MKHSPRTIGFIQAAGLALYVSVFATAVQQLQNWPALRDAELSPVVGISLFLLTFIISALICSSVALGYPLFLFFSGARNEAMKTVLWTLVWLVVIAAVIAIVSFSLLPRS